MSEVITQECHSFLHVVFNGERVLCIVPKAKRSIRRYKKEIKNRWRHRLEHEKRMVNALTVSIPLLVKDEESLTRILYGANSLLKN